MKDSFKYILAVVLYGTNGLIMNYISFPSELVVFARGSIGALVIYLFLRMRRQSIDWELSMMFSLAGIISYKMLQEDKNSKMFGLPCKLSGALSMALLFALFESFLAGTSNNSFIWVYKWWGVIPVFITTYIPFFLASNYIPFMKNRKQIVIGMWALIALLLAILIPLGII